MDTLQETNISPKKGILKMIFLFPRWDMLIPRRVCCFWGGLPSNDLVTSASLGPTSQAVQSWAYAVQRAKRHLGKMFLKKGGWYDPESRNLTVFFLKGLMCL